MKLIRKTLLILFLLNLKSNIFAQSPLDVRVPRSSGMAPFTLQAHIFSRDEQAEKVIIELESLNYYSKKEISQDRLIEFRKANLGNGEYQLKVTVIGGPENKVLHQQSLDIRVGG